MRRLVTIVSFLALAAPLATGAVTVNELTQQIAALMQQINAVQTQIQAVGGTTSAAPSQFTQLSGNTAAAQCNFARTLSLGASGSDVAALQQYLIRSGLLSAGAASGFFDAQTETAVQQWQASHGVVFSGTPATTGFGVAGPRTRALLSINCALPQSSSTGPSSCSLAPPPTTSCSTGWQANTDSYGCTTSYKCAIPFPGLTSSTCNAVSLVCPQGSHVQTGMNCSQSCVSGVLLSQAYSQTTNGFSASPVSGAASLAVTFTAAGLTADTYSVNFGDGFAAQMRISSCSNIATDICTYQVAHTYTFGGNFTASFSGSWSGQLGTTLIAVH